MLDALTNFDISTLTLGEAAVAIIASLVASVLCYLIYQLFYGSRHIGAGVHRTFLIGGPAITTIFVVIQTSIPLGLGLLGALSFVRFRTPVKDPAEIGYLLLLIASSIGVSTANYLITFLLFVAVFLVQGTQWLLSNRVSLGGTGHLVVSVEQSVYPDLEKKLNLFFKERLPGLRLETMSTVDNRVGLHYQYRKKSDFDWTEFNDELNELTGATRVEIFIS